MSGRAGRVDGAQALQVAGILAAVVLAAVVNVLGARHFTRWDWTRDRRWSLSPATVETLRSLRTREVHVTLWVVAGEADPDPLWPATRAHIMAMNAQVLGDPELSP